MLLSISFHFDFFPLLVVAGIAWFTPVFLSLFKLKKIPSVILEIILGYFVGRYLLEGIDHESFRLLEFFALSGFIFLMFLGGLEIDVDQILASLPRRKLTYARFLKNPLMVGTSQFVVAIVLAYGGTLLLSRIINIPHVWYFSLIMVTTSVGIVLPVLKDRGEVNTRFGQMIIISAAIADIFSIILFTFTAFIIKQGFHLDLLLILALIVLFFIVYKLVNRFKDIPVFKKLSYQLSQAASQIRIRGSILMIVIFVVISQYIGEEVVLLGAFLSGLVLSSMLHRERSLLLVKPDGMGFGFFIPFFFIMVGVEFDPSALAEFDQSLIWFLLALLVTLYAIKMIPAFFWKRLFGTRKAVSGGVLMSSRLSLIIAAAAIGLKLGVITEGINASFIIMAVVTCFASPVIYNWMSPGNILSGNKTIIVGGSSTAVLLARRLNVHGRKAIIVENDEKRFREISDKGISVVHGDGCRQEVFEKLKLKPDNYVVIETGDDEQNLKVSRMLRNEFQHEKIISRISRFSLEGRYKALGVETIDVTQILATAIENLIVRPTTYHALVESFENFSVDEIPVNNKEVDGLQLKEVPFHKDAILMMVKRGNNFYIPHGETYFRLGDVLHVFGTDTALEDTRRKISGA
ncbi:MAG: monovalent cation:proton antiporter family protein [Bacteroidales bacterium]|nr:monovalent cation:proton antiporter family protein [Bacteroidales bacterium]